MVKISNFQPDGWEFYTTRGQGEMKKINVEKECGDFSAQSPVHPAVNGYLALSRGDKTTVCAIIPQWSSWDFGCPHHSWLVQYSAPASTWPGFRSLL